MKEFKTKLLIFKPREKTHDYSIHDKTDVFYGYITYNGIFNQWVYIPSRTLEDNWKGLSEMFMVEIVEVIQNLNAKEIA